MLPASRSTSRSASRLPGASASASSSAVMTLAPPGWQTIRSIGRSPIAGRLLATAAAISAVTKPGIERSNTTPSPASSTSQPMICNVSGHMCCAPRPTTGPWSAGSELSTAAPAPSPNSAVAMMSAFCIRSMRNRSVQVSTATTSTRAPGRAAAISRAMDRPDTPPAQPRPNTGTRSRSGRNPISTAARASSVGVATPVEEMVTTASIRSALSPASASAPRAASRNRSIAPAT